MWVTVRTCQYLFNFARLHSPYLSTMVILNPNEQKVFWDTNSTHRNLKIKINTLGF
jgi:hypothetical protein